MFATLPPPTVLTHLIKISFGDQLTTFFISLLSAIHIDLSPGRFSEKINGILTLFTFSKVLTNFKTLVPIPVPKLKETI